jgi:hypothetical protein
MPTAAPSAVWMPYAKLLKLAKRGRRRTKRTKRRKSTSQLPATTTVARSPPGVCRRARGTSLSPTAARRRARAASPRTARRTRRRRQRRRRRGAPRVSGPRSMSTATSSVLQMSSGAPRAVDHRHQPLPTRGGPRRRRPRRARSAPPQPRARRASTEVYWGALFEQRCERLRKVSVRRFFVQQSYAENRRRFDAREAPARAAETWGRRSDPSCRATTRRAGRASQSPSPASLPAI